MELEDSDSHGTTDLVAIFFTETLPVDKHDDVFTNYR